MKLGLLFLLAIQQSFELIDVSLCIIDSCTYISSTCSLTVVVEPILLLPVLLSFRRSSLKLLDIRNSYFFIVTWQNKFTNLWDFWSYVFLMKNWGSLSFECFFILIEDPGSIREFFNEKIGKISWEKNTIEKNREGKNLSISTTLEVLENKIKLVFVLQKVEKLTSVSILPSLNLSSIHDLSYEGKQDEKDPEEQVIIDFDNFSFFAIKKEISCQVDSPVCLDGFLLFR